MFLQLFSSNILHPIFLYTISLILLKLPEFHAQEIQQFSECRKQTFNCGKNIREIVYPFWGGNRPSYCGLNGFELVCQNDDIATIRIESLTFRLLSINQYSHEIKIARTVDIQGDRNICPAVVANTISNRTLFGYNPGTEIIYLYYDCPSVLTMKFPNSSIWGNFTCTKNGAKNYGFYSGELFSADELRKCKTEMVAAVLRGAFKEFRETMSMAMAELLKQGFLVDYIIDEIACSACENSGGLCGSDVESSRRFQCICRNGVHAFTCPHPGSKNSRVPWKIGIGLGSAAVGIACTVLAFFIYNRRKKTKHGSSLISRNISSDPSSISDSEKGGTYSGVPIFSYNELEQATDNFDSNKEVGDGGFGTVYKGKLQDGRVVAIKRLYENNFKRVEQFMNEIEILARLRHRNLVSLYGCTSQHGRELLLVYEYIPNGTIADHLHGERAKPGCPSWKTRLSIGIETASALAYLHASDVIHRDVKTTNILLDNNFSVKVADFGLSRLFPFNVTHVSTAPQGTPGYVDPEYHECYQLTSKSDVYSFGVVLIELISSKPAVDITRHRHEINLSNMAINKIQNDALHELVDPSLGFESNYEVQKMITEVAELAFQCLANERDLRPSMQEVLKKLTGIQSKYYGNKNQVEVDLFDDDASLLKNNPQILSPDSVTVKWVSSSDTSSYST